MKTLTCPNCSKVFSTNRSKRFCDRRCAATISAAMRGTPVWEAEAEALLEQLAGTMPMPKLTQRFNQAANRYEWAKRSETAIKIKLKRLGCSRKATLDNISAIELARILNLKRDRVERWVELSLLPYEKVARNLGSIKLSDFAKFAECHPERLAGIQPDILLWIGLNSALVDQIAALPPPVHGLPQPVKRADTGEVFCSIKEASRRNYADPSGISLSIRQNRPVSGIQWEAIA